MTSTQSSSQTPSVQQPLSFSHLFLQLLLEATDSDILHHAPYIISIVQTSASFEPNKQVSDDILKTVAHNCLNQQQSQTQISSQLTNLVNAGNQPLSLLFQRFSNLFLQSSTLEGSKKVDLQHQPQSILAMSTSTKQRITTGLSLLDLFIAQCDFSLLQNSAIYLHQILFTFLKQEQNNQVKNDIPLPSSFYLKALHLLTKLYIRASTAGWASIFQSLPSIRSTLDSLFTIAMLTLPFSTPNSTLDNETSPHFRQLTAYDKPIQSITPGAMAVIEYILHILLSLYQHNGTRSVLKTHLPHTFTLLFSLCDLDIHAQTHTTLQSLGPTKGKKAKSFQHSRVLPLMGQIFALSCYNAKFNDIKQSLTNYTTSSKDLEPLLLSFPSDVFLQGLSAHTVLQKTKKEKLTPAQLAKKTTNLDTFLTNHQNEDGNGILIDTTKTAQKAIHGISDEKDKASLTLIGGVVSKQLNERQLQGSQNLLQLKVAVEDKIAEAFLTDEFETTQQVIFNRQQQILHLDLKRCVVTMLVTTIVHHLIAAIPSMVPQHASFIQLSDSLAQSQRNAGFIVEQPLAFVLPTLPEHIDTETIPYQQLVTSRTLSLFALLQALITVSPHSLQSNSEMSTTYSNLQWLGFAGPGATFMQGTHREIFNSSANKQSGHNQFSTDKSGATSVTTGSELDQIVVITPPTLPTSLTMSFGTQNEQFHIQQQNQQQFQFEFPLFRVLQLFHVIFEIELNAVCVTKELFYLNQFIPPLQITALSTFQSLLQSTAKHSIIYIPTFIPSLFALYQSVLTLNRSTYLLSNINLNLLQQHLLSTFSFLLSTFSISVFPSNILTQLIPIILFDLMTYIHDLTRVQQQHKFVSIQKEVTDLTKGPNQQEEKHHYGKSTIPLSRVVQAMSNVKGASFSNLDSTVTVNKKSSAAILTGASTKADSQSGNSAQFILANPSRAVLTPHTLHVPTFDQQYSREVVMIDTLFFLTSMFTTTTSSLLLTNDLFVAISRCVVMIIHTFLTPQGGSLLPFSTPFMINIFALLNELAQFTPRIGCLSPILGEAMTYFTWLLHSPIISTELHIFAKQSLSQLATLVAPAMMVPSLPVETIVSLDQLRDRTLASLAAHGGSDSTQSTTLTASSSNKNSNQFTFGGDSMSDSKSSNNSSLPFGSFDPNISFPLLLYPFQQSTFDPTTSPVSLQEYMLSTYHSYTRNLNITVSSDLASSGLSANQVSISDPFTHFSHTSSTTAHSTTAFEKPVQFDTVAFEEVPTSPSPSNDIDPGFVLSSSMNNDNEYDNEKAAKLFTAPAAASFLTDLSNIDDDDDLDLAIDFAG